MDFRALFAQIKLFADNSNRIGRNGECSAQLCR